MTFGRIGPPGAARNVVLYPWFRFCRGLLFWQAVWFLFFQNRLSAADAILLYVVYDIATTALEVPSGWMSDKLGRRLTLVASAVTTLTGAALLATGDSFPAFALGQALLGTGMAFASGTDSALLYESLVAEGRDAEVERQELRAWRLSFTALAFSAVTGGFMSLWVPVLPFVATTVAAAAVLAITLGFREPARTADLPEGSELARVGALGRVFRQPVLVWLFALSLLMYAFSHVPFVFGQPFILEALRGIGLDGEAPAVSGVVTAAMMLVSVAVSLIAPALRQRLGLGRLLMLAFGMQVALIGVLSLSGSVLAIAVLFLRMVPDSLSKPFILARIQPLLGDQTRATYLSLQSFAGRLLLAGTLAFAAVGSPEAGSIAQAEVQRILGLYAAGGLVCWFVLVLCLRNAGVDPRYRGGTSD